MSIMAKSRGEITYKDLSGANKWFLIALISMGSSVVYTPMYLKGVFYDPLMEALGCTNADLGFMVSLYGITAMICYLPSGIIADKFRMRTLATVGFFGTAILTLIYATLPSLTTCYILFVGMGVTSILIWWGTRFKVVRLCCSEADYASKIGTSYSIYGVTGLVVGLANTAIVSSIASAVQGVQIMLIFLGVLIAILGVLSLIFLPDFKGEINKDSKMFSLKEAKEAITYPGVIWGCLAYLCIYAIYQGSTYTTPYLTACFGAPIAIVSILGIIRTYGIGLLAGPAAGILGDKLKSPSKSIIIFVAAAAIVFVAFMVLPHSEAFLIAGAALVVVIGFATYGAFSIGSSTLTETHIPMSIFGTAVGVLSVIGYLPDVFIHTWFGSMIDASGNDAYYTIFAILFLLSAASLFCLYMLRRSIKKNSGAVAEAAEATEAPVTEEIVEEVVVETVAEPTDTAHKA